MEKANSRMSLYTQVALSFLVLVLFLAFSISISIWQIKKVNGITSDLVTVKMPLVQASLEILIGVNQSSASFRGWLLKPESQFEGLLNQSWNDKVNPGLQKFGDMALQSKNAEKIKTYEDIKGALEKVRASQMEIMDLYRSDKNKAMERFFVHVEALTNPVRSKLQEVINIENQLMSESSVSVENSMRTLTFFQWGMLILGVVSGVYLSRRLAKGISDPVINLAVASEDIAKGDLNKAIELGGGKEIQQLGVSIQNIMQTMRSITSAAKKISDGDYQQTIAPRSEHDDLLIAINNMTQTLRQNKQYYEDQAWLQQGANQILVCVAKNPELNSLCSEILAEMCRYLEAGIGALYLFDESQQKLHLASSFAYTERAYLANEFKLGDGIVGQVGLERKPILLKNIKREDLVIATGISQEPPINTYTFPMVDKENLVGVIELAFHEAMSPLKMDFITLITPLITGNIRICEQKEETERLLTYQQTLTQELQVQQEELKAANEELETQTEELKSSEEELRVNEEEQRTLNQALEERNKLLQEQTQSLKEAQDELLGRTEQIQQASKYKSEFLANMSHELRTPLNSLLILSKLLAENKEQNLNSEQVDSLRVIHRSGMDLLQLINDVLDLAKVEAGKLKLEVTELMVKDFVDLLKDDFQAMADEKHLQFSVDLKSGILQSIYSDAQRLKQILKNLLSNAFKFTEKGGVSIEVHTPANDTLFKSSYVTKDNCIAFTVKDTGIGIPKEKHELIFETFFQGDGALNRKYNGTGLGLSISQQLTTLLHGEIHVESTENEGSAFTLYVPYQFDESNKLTPQEVKHQESKKEEVMELDISPNVKRNKVLLIVEDDVQFAKILADVCSKKGYECKYAVDGKEGFSIAHKEVPACIFLDINLSDMSGLALADQLKNNPRTKNIPIHFISGSDKSEEAMKHGAASYLMKPITIEKLDLAIDSVSHSINEKISSLLVVEDDDVLRMQIQKSYEEKSIQVLGAGTGQEALNLLRSQQFDCMILDLGLPDISGFDLLKTINDNDEYSHPAVIVYTGREFSEEDHQSLQNYSKNIIIKGKMSLERLLDESALFIHQVEKTGVLRSEDTASSLEIKNELKGKKILLVDDDMRNTFSLAKLMNGMGVHTAIAANGKIAIDMLLKEHDFDGVLLDIMMPVMDGFETIEKIRQMQKFKNLPIIALTAKAMQSDKEKCLQLGATDYLAKPLDVDKLLILMRAYLCQ